MDQKSFKRMKKGNTVINAGICMGSIAIFGFNPIALCLCYIGSDIMLSIVDKAVKNGVIKKNVTHETANSLSDMLNYYGSHIATQKEKKEISCFLSALHSEQEKYMIQVEELRKKEEENKKAELMAQIRGLGDVLKVADGFIEFYDMTVSDNEKIDIEGLQNVYEEFKLLKSNLEKKPESSGIVDGCLRTYTNEMISLISTYPSIPEGKKDEYEKKYTELAKEFATFLKGVNEKIDRYSVEEANFSLNTLLSELKEVNKINDKD